MPTNDGKGDASGSHSTRRFWIIGISAVFMVWIATYLYMVIYRADLSWSERGGFGEMFGVINSLFAGLAFVGVAVTLYLQSRELIRTRREVEQQQFETKFFQLLHIQNDILQGIQGFSLAANQ